MSLDRLNWFVSLNRDSDLILLTMKNGDTPVHTFPIPYRDWEVIVAYVLDLRQKLPAVRDPEPLSAVEQAELVARFKKTEAM